MTEKLKLTIDPYEGSISIWAEYSGEVEMYVSNNHMASATMSPTEARSLAKMLIAAADEAEKSTILRRHFPS